MTGMRILGLGDNTVDTYVDLGLQFPGGNAVNVAVLAGRLGAAPAYLGCIGRDEAAGVVSDALAAEGVETSRLRRLDGPNARAFIAHRDGDRRFISSSRGVRGQYGWQDDDFAYVAGFDAVHTSIYSELDDVLPRLARSALQLSYDHSERWTPESLERTLPFLTTAFLSCPALDDDACRALLRRSAAAGPQVVVATRGKAGAMAIAGGEILVQPAVPATVVDTLGAGDGFIAAFLVERLRGAPLAAALGAGAAFAAQVCSWQGAFGRGVPWTSTGDSAATRAG